MKKIVYILGGASAPNGMSRVLIQKINYLAENTTYKIYAILTETTNKPLYYKISDKVDIVNLNINFDELDTMSLFKKLLYYNLKQFRYKRRMNAFLMQLNSDIVVSAMRREINFINHIKDGSIKVGEIHFNNSSYRIFNKSYLPKLINKTITKYWRNKLYKEINRLNRFVVLSNEDSLEWNGINNLMVIYNPIAHFQDRINSLSSKKIIAVGRYTEQKGFDMLIDAWKIVFDKHPDWSLNIYGDGDYMHYQNMATEKGVGKSLICHRAVKNIYDKYLESSIFVFSSRYEGFGLVLAEAMSCGLPAVSFSCPCGPKDIITDGEDGILVEPNNILSLADKISMLIEDEQLRRKMGAKAKVNMRRFEEDKIMNQWISLFDELTQ